jgi:hypothetical protein
MQSEFDRPKVIPSTTEDIKLPNCGTLHLTLGHEKEGGRLIEVRAVIGRNACCGFVLLDTIAKLMSFYLQSPEPRWKIKELFNRCFMPDGKGGRIVCSHGKEKSCVEEIAERVIRELE